LGNLSSSIALASAFATQKRAPPGSWGGDLLQILRPEQPMLPVREAHVQCPVLVATVATYDLADQAPSLLYPVVLLDLHSHTHACIVRLHDYQIVSSRCRHLGSISAGCIEMATGEQPAFVRSLLSPYGNRASFLIPSLPDAGTYAHPARAVHPSSARFFDTFRSPKLGDRSPSRLSTAP
jgi:hypothetical protein